MSSWERTLGTGLTAAIEQVLNRALALDPASERALRALLDEPFLLQFTPPGQSIYLAADERTIRVQLESAVAPVLALKGSPLAFAAVALGDEGAFRDGRITAEGDIARAHRLQRILQQLDPDWEGSLAGVIGDVPAHFLARRLRQSLRWSRETREVLSRNLEEYLHEESDALPARPEAEALFDDIDELRLDIDRLDARLERIERQRSKVQRSRDIADTDDPVGGCE